MKQFRFIGGEDSIYWGVFEPNQFYDEDFKEPSFPAVIELAETSPKDWEEVTEQEGCYAIPKTETNRIPNQDQPASSMTKFEMAVFMAMQGIIYRDDYASIDVARECIAIVKQTFEELENQNK